MTKETLKPKIRKKIIFLIKIYILIIILSTVYVAFAWSEPPFAETYLFIIGAFLISFFLTHFTEKIIIDSENKTLSKKILFKERLVDLKTFTSYRTYIYQKFFFKKYTIEFFDENNDKKDINVTFYDRNEIYFFLKQNNVKNKNV